MQVETGSDDASAPDGGIATVGDDSAPVVPDATEDASDVAAVHVDTIGTVPTEAPVTLLATALPDGVRERLLSGGRYALVRDPAASEQADLVVVSTRMPRGESLGLIGNVRKTSDTPIAVLVHPGGELLAAELMRAGGSGVVAEGNEDALRALLDGQTHDTSLVDVYEQHIVQSHRRADLRHGRDPSTHLPGKSAFEHRLADAGQSVETPRIGFVRVLNLVEPGRQLSSEALLLLRRRLAVQFRHLSQQHNVELFALSDTDFALIGPTLSPNRAEQLGVRMSKVAETFAPTGGHTLALAMGHAGSEVSQDPKSLRELAQRALDVAATEKESAVVSAEMLSLDGSSTTELEAAIRVLSLVEQQGSGRTGHGSRIASHASELARHLGYEGPARTRVQLAAYLHDIGKIGLPSEAVTGSDELFGELLDAYRSHPARGADYLRVSAGAEVAEAVRFHHEHWDGSGFPEGRRGEDIPVGARVIAIADMFEELLQHPDGSTPSVEEAVAALREAAGTRLDPNLVQVAAPLLRRQALQAAEGDERDGASS